MARIKDILNSSLDMIVPHARRQPFNPMAYVRDMNEWFLPWAQMALDEYEGKENYPGLSYALAALPLVGKVAKPLSKAVSKTPSISEVISMNKPIQGARFKELDNDVTRKAAERIKKLEAQNREFEKINRTAERFDKYGNRIGDGTWHANYQVYDIPGTEVSISPSQSSESVYVTYSLPNGKSSQARYSTHHSNTEDKDIVDILYDLGMVESKPRIQKKLLGQNVKKREVERLPSSGKTYTELLSLPVDELQKYKNMLIVDENGNKKNWIFGGDTWEDVIGRDFFIKDEFKDLFKDY